MPDVTQITCPVDHFRVCNLNMSGKYINRSSVSGDVYVARCANCGIGVTQPPLEDVSALYSDRQSQDFQGRSGIIGTLLKKIAFRRGAKQLLLAVGSSPASVIDYGCGSGLFTRSIAEALPASARVIGADFHDTPPAELKGVEYRSFDCLEDLIEKVDLVLAMHVIEHDNDPKALIAKLARFLRPGGKIVIEVPFIDCIWASIFGRFWDSWYLPYHRVHFSRQALRAMVQGSGLAVLNEMDVSVPSMGRTVASVLGKENGPGFIMLSAVLQPIQVGLEWMTRRPSALRILAERHTV